MPTLLNSLGPVWAFENNNVNSATKIVNNASYFPVAASRSCSIFLFAGRTGTAGAVSYFDMTINKSGGPIYFKHRFRRSNWVAGQRKHAIMNLPGGICPGVNDELLTTMDSIDTGSISFVTAGARL